MRRRLLDLLTLLSLLLCVVVCALWVESRQAGHRVGYRFVAAHGPPAWCEHITLGSGDGVIVIGVERHLTSGEPPAEPIWETHSPWAPVQLFNIRPRRGFGYAASRTNEKGVMVARSCGLSFPLWIPAGLLTVIPVTRFCRRLRRRRYPHGLCQHCGYDLTGNMSGVCPECGKSLGLSLKTAHRNC